MWKLRENIKFCVNSHSFEVIVIAVIIINSISLGIDTFTLPNYVQKIITLIDYFSLCFFVCELAMKIYAYGIKGFFKNGWNLMDFIIIVLSIIPGISFVSSIRLISLMRLLRVLRIARLFSGIKKLRAIVDAIISSLASVFWTCLLLLIVDYLYSIIGTVLFSEISSEYFGNLWKSLYTLFMLMTADDLGNITRPIIEVMPMSFIYFVSFIIIIIFLILNVIVGIMVDSISEIRKKSNEISVDDEDAIAKIEKIRKELDELEIIIKNEKQ